MSDDEENENRFSHALPPAEQAYVREQREALENWDWRSEMREKLRPKGKKFTDAKKAIFLRQFALTERFYASAYTAGVVPETVRRHLLTDKEFFTAFEEAKERYRDMVYAARNKALFEGYAEPIVGGKDKDAIITHKQNFPFQVLLKELQRLDPAYKDKAEIDMNMKGGVLVVPGRAGSMEEWNERLDELNTRQKAQRDEDESNGST